MKIDTRSALAALVFCLFAFFFLVADSSFAYYHPPANVPPGPPPNYNQVDTSYFMGVPTLPGVNADSGGYYIWVDNTSAWNIAFRIFKTTGGDENYHGSVLASMSSPPTPGVNVFATNFEIYGDTANSYCYKQNDRWGWYQWDANLYEIWWDVSTRYTSRQYDSTDVLKICIRGCAIDFNVWSDDWDGRHFDADNVFLGASRLRLSRVPGFSDTYSGISDPYASTGHSGDRNCSAYTRHPGSGSSYNKYGLISLNQEYPCDRVLCGYGSRFGGAFTYEGNGLEFSAGCVYNPCQGNNAPVLQPPYSYNTFQCTPIPFSFDVDYFDDGNFDHFEKLSGPGTINSSTGVVTFTPGPATQSYTFRIMGTDICGASDTADYAVNIQIDSPPVVSCPGHGLLLCDINMTLCSLSPVNLPGFTWYDADNNITSVTAIGGTLHGDTMTFTPVVGTNTLEVIARDACGLADTCITLVGVSLNSRPDAVSPANSNQFVCALTEIRLPGFSATDVDGNLSTKVLTGGVLHGDTAYFTPVVGANTLRLVATDACGLTDTSTTVVTVTLNHAPDAVSPANSNQFVCALTEIRLPGFTATDVDGNLSTKVLTGGVLHGDTAYFTPVVGANTLRLVATDACGLTDTSFTVVTITLNQVPNAVSPANQNMFVCALDQICISGFAASDPDNNLATLVLQGGTLHGDTACFIPVVGANTLRLIATDACGAVDTSITVVTITANHLPEAVSPADTSIFVCALNQICLPGFTASDIDNNLVSKTLIGATLQGDTACFTPVAGLNTIRIIALDACGAVDTNTTNVTVTLNSAPLAVSPNDTSFVHPDLSPICLHGFAGSDIDNNLVSKTISVGNLSGDSVCFTPVQGVNTLTLICTDACGVADTSITHVTVNVSISLAVAGGTLPEFTEEVADSFIVVVTGGDPGSLAFTTAFTSHTGYPGRYSAALNGSNLKIISTFDYLGEFSSAQSPFADRIIVFDGHSADTLDLLLIVHDSNRNPAVGSINDTTILVGSTLAFTVNGNDPDLDNTLTLSKTAGSGTFISTPGLPPVTGNYSWTPAVGDIGTHQVNFSIDDGRGASANDLVNINVEPSGIDLHIFGGGGIPPVFTEEVTDSFYVTLGGFDPSSFGFSTSFPGHTGSPARYAATFEDNQIKVVVTFDYLGEFSYINSAFPYRIIASDNFSVDTLELSLIVNDNNREPGIMVGSNYTVMVDHPLTFSVLANDLDLDNTLALSKISGPGSFAGASGPSPVSSSFSWTPTVADLPSSPYLVKFAVNDGHGGVDTANVTITLFPDGVPIIEILYTPTIFREGQQDSIVFRAHDPDGDPMGGFGFKFIPPAPDSTFSGLSFRTHGDTAFTRITFDYAGAWSSTNSPFPARLTAFSAVKTTTADTASLTISLTVLNTNRKPNLVVTGPHFATAMSTISLGLHVTDLDVDDILMLTATDLPLAAVFVDNGSGEGTFNWLTTPADTGNYNFRFYANDGRGMANSRDTVIWSLRVAPPDTTGCGELGNTSQLLIDCPNAISGSTAEVTISLFNEGCVGGFKILVSTDPTALSLTDVQWLDRTHFGNEYHNWAVDPIGPGSDKFVWIADMNDGIYTPPMGAVTAPEPILKLIYAVTPGLDWETEIQVKFDSVDYRDNSISDETGYEFVKPSLFNGCVHIVNPAIYRGDPNMNGIYYEIADDVIVARRLIHGLCDGVIWTINIPVQEAASDLNENGFTDVADLVRFINITTGAIPMPPHPKTDPSAVDAFIFPDDGQIFINSITEVGAALVKIAHSGEIGAPVAANGMNIMYQDEGGVLSVLVYSMNGRTIPAGNQTLFTLEGQGRICEAQVSDAAGNLLISRIGTPVPTAFAVSNNYPNPFNAQTMINFALPTASDVTVNIYSITGQVVETIKGHYEAGNQSIIWNASHMASGVYFAKVSAGSNSQTLKMVLIK